MVGSKATSLSLDIWQTKQARRLDEIRAAHALVGGPARGRRHATQQINRAYAVLLAAQFQGFCATFHSECTRAILPSITPRAVQELVRTNFLFGRTLDRGNAGPGNIGQDFSRLGMQLWNELYALDGRNRDRNRKLEELNKWRNAIAHDDFKDRATFPLGRDTILRLSKVERWRSACNRLAFDMDRSMRSYLKQLSGQYPW